MDKKFIITILVILLLSISKSIAFDLQNLNTKAGIITLMYHRFNENEYPSTNIRNEIFKKHLEQINKTGTPFITFKKFDEIMQSNIDKNYLLLTIDDAFESFYLSAWPILKEKKIPFILFVSTREVGNYGYMTWEQIKEIEEHKFTTIGNHSHTHEYLIDWGNKKIKQDLETSISIFKKKIGYAPEVFAYPFGEYSSDLKEIVSKLNFKYAFGQHSGAIDATKDYLELPRFSINEKYGELKRFKSILQTLPFPYKSISPKNRYLKEGENPPDLKIKFFDNLINVENINCYSNEGNVWEKSKIKFTKKNELTILFREKFKSERGRINCSLWEEKGRWRWLGIQFVIAEY